ncbi:MULTISPECIES: hypothetical protein [unclassified Streptomyces]|uniref:hypothetical protein n=1 Tax=unclassified Streptomyces TaxID=2593676 RepID=UPI0036EC7182
MADAAYGLWPLVVLDTLLFIAFAEEATGHGSAVGGLPADDTPSPTVHGSRGTR